MLSPPRPPPKKPPPPPGKSEQRRHERVELLAQIELRRGEGGDVLILPIINISAGGVLLKADPQGMRGLRVGEPVGVFLDLEASGLSLAMDAEIVRLDLGSIGRPAGVALMWTSTDPEAVATLSRILFEVR